MSLTFIIEQLSDLYEETDARAWALSPQQLLDGQVAAALIEINREDEVLAAIRQLRDGIHL